MDEAIISIIARSDASYLIEGNALWLFEGYKNKPMKDCIWARYFELDHFELLCELSRAIGITSDSLEKFEGHSEFLAELFHHRLKLGSAVFDLVYVHALDVLLEVNRTVNLDFLVSGDNI